MKNFKSFYFLLIVLIGINGCSKKEQPAAPADDKSFTAFRFLTFNNSMLLQDVEGEIEDDTIYAATFAGTSVTDLKASFVFKGETVTVDDVEQKTGTNTHDFTTPLAYTIHSADGSTKKYFVKLEDTHLPAIYISTNDVAITSKDNYVNGSMWILGNLKGDTLYKGTLQIRGRGNSTWEMPKKPYKVKLDKKFPLLGMNTNKEWALLANYGDFSLIRNEVGFELSRRLGMAFTPASRYADVILNGVYLGNYQLTETITDGTNRVNIEEQDPASNALPDIAGGYLLEVDGYAYTEPVHFNTPHSMPITVHYPKDDEINTAQLNYIKNYYTEFETALFGSNFKDTATGYQKYLDVPSFINYYLVNEIIGNPDLFWSTYQYKTRNDPKLYTGPVWDFDLGGNDDSRLGDAVNKMMVDDGHDPKQWINRLMEDPAFRRAIRNRWNEIKTSVGTIDQFVDAMAAQLDLSQKANFKKWDILDQIIHLNLQASGSYKGEIDFLRSFLQRRIPWLDTQFNSVRFNQ